MGRFLENIKRYAENKFAHYNAISKYIICPGYNDNKKEVDKWMQSCLKCGIESITISVENSWLKQHRNSGNEEIVQLIRYILDKGQNVFNTCVGENHVMQLLAGVEN